MNKSTIQDAEYLERVRQQYENYPYPMRDPEDERKRLKATEINALNRINFYAFGGQQDFRKARFLFAGCGTGDEVIFTAQQVRDYPDAELVAIDISEASLDIAKRRAEIRGLKNITWIHNSLLEIPKLDLGEFDYINSSGVLHHLEDPDLGLKTLESALKPDGAIGIMLYAKYGRTGVYQMQELMRRINKDEKNLQTQVDNTKVVIKSLPSTNWYKKSEHLFSDIDEMGDIGLYDLLLHPQDRAYSIPELYDYAKKAGLQIIEHTDYRTRAIYNPRSHIRNPELLNKVLKLDKPTQAAISEIIYGQVTQQSIYLAREIPTRLSFDDLGNIPFLFNFFEKDIHLIIADAMADWDQQQFRIHDPNVDFTFPMGHYTKYFFKHLDGDSNTDTILNKVMTDINDPNLSRDTLLNEFRSLYHNFQSVDRMLLRDPKIKKLKGLSEY